MPTQRPAERARPIPSSAESGHDTSSCRSSSNAHAEPGNRTRSSGLGDLSVLGSGHFCRPTTPAVEPFPTDAALPPDLPALYEGLARRSSTVDPNGADTAARRRPIPTGIRKYLPMSYRTAFNFTNPRTEFAKTDDSYHCAIKRIVRARTQRSHSPATSHLGPGDRVLSPPAAAGRAHRPAVPAQLHAVRRRIFQGRRLDFVPAHVGARRLFDRRSRQASCARTPRAFPPIEQPRQLFAPILFPCRARPGAAQWRLRHAEDRSVRLRRRLREDRARGAAGQREHPRRGAGWPARSEGHRRPSRMGRRADPDLAEPPDAVRSRHARASASRRRSACFRIAWMSARRAIRTGARSCEIRNKAALTLGRPNRRPAPHRVETGVQVFPSTVNGDRHAPTGCPATSRSGTARRSCCRTAAPRNWMQPARWPIPALITTATSSANPDQKGNLYEPLLPGCRAQVRPRIRVPRPPGRPFRRRACRGDAELNDAPATSSSLIFRRYVAPKQLKRDARTIRSRPRCRGRAVLPGDSFTVVRPRLGYPALLFTELDTNGAFQKLLDDKAFCISRQGRRADHQRVSRGQLLRSRRRSHAGRGGHQDA